MPPSALVLNIDHRPLTYLPLSTLEWEMVVHNVLLDQLTVLEEYDIPIRSQYLKMNLPSVVATTKYVQRSHHIPLTNHNLFVLRDKKCCAYCGKKFGLEHLTRDHVIPRSQGGHTTWGNIVTACGECNWRKSGRTPQQAGMPLLWRPHKPTVEELMREEHFLNRRHIHETWKAYLPQMD